LAPRDAAGAIKDVFQSVENELPKSRTYVGDSFGISDLIGLYYSYDDIPFNDTHSAREIDLELITALTRLAADTTDGAEGSSPR
jgi:hypothetical protein